MSFNNLCWCCLLRPSDKDLRKPNFDYGISEIYSDLLDECFQIQLIESHEGDCGICELCVRRLRDARDFKVQVQRCQDELRARLRVKVFIKEEKPDKEESRDWSMLHEEISIKPDIEDQGEDAINNEMLYEVPNVKSEIPDADVAEENMSHALDEEPPGESEMSDNDLSDSCLTLRGNESDGDITAADLADSDMEDLPRKSKERYLATYDSFMAWRKQKNATSFSQNVLLAYFKKMSDKYKPTSVWTMYSMLKRTLKSKQCINMEDYTKLTAFLRRKSDGYVSRKAKGLTAEEANRFIDEAPDQIYLVTKAVLIFGACGSLTTEDLFKLSMDHLEDLNDRLLVKFPFTKNKIPTTFVIEGKYYDVVKKYASLRVEQGHEGTFKRFFQQYKFGRCIAAGIGKNKFKSIPKEIAAYLDLPDAKLYTGHSFRNTFAGTKNNQKDGG